MLALRYSPFQQLQNELRNHFEQVLGDRQTSSRTFAPSGFPALNAWEDEQGYYVEAELPGLALENLEIYVADRSTLTIKGERKQPENLGTWHRRERGYGSFEREITLPGYVDADHVEASLKFGVLTIKLPKSPEMQPRKIEVKAS